MRARSIAFLLPLWLCTLSGVAQELISAPTTATAIPQETEAEIAQRKALFQQGSFSSKKGLTIPYRMLAPRRPISGSKYPLVLILHGSGAIGRDNEAQLGLFVQSWARPEIAERFPAYVLAPQFPTRSAVYAPSKEDGLLASASTPALAAGLELVQKLSRKLPIDRSRIYIVGFSMGASAGWHSLLLQPGFFAAAVLISGVPPERTRANELSNYPLLITHGNADQENPFAPDKAMFLALQKAGATQIRFREYDKADHIVPPDIFRTEPENDWWREWLFQQRRK